MAHLQFDITKQKLRIAFNQSVENQSDLNDLDTRQPKFSDRGIIKSINTIPLATDESIDLNLLTLPTFTVLLENYPDFAIPFTRIHFTYSIADGFDIPNLFSNSFRTQQRWKRVDNNHLQIDGFVSPFVVSKDFEIVTVFVDISLTILNTKVYEQVQSYIMED